MSISLAGSVFVLAGTCSDFAMTSLRLLAVPVLLVAGKSELHSVSSEAFNPGAHL
jgi:hypothetical protein